MLRCLRQKLNTSQASSKTVFQALRALKARYDAAATTDENRRHWQHADDRYEIANNSYARGLVLTLANDVVGTGPRLQMLTTSTEINRRIEQAFSDWSKAIRLADKLRTMRMARVADGEAFAMLTSNPRLSGSIKLDMRLIEADQVTTPDLKTIRENEVDDLSGLRVSAKSRPIQRDHDSSRIVGYTDKIELKAGSIRLSGLISGSNEHARELVAECARLEGHDIPRVFGDGKAVISAGFSTIALPGILESVMNRTMLASYEASPIAALQLCAVGSVSDFKEVSRYRLLGTGGFEKVSPTGELKSGTVAEAKCAQPA